MTLALVPGQAEQYCTFELGGEHYAVPDFCVREVLHDVAVTHVPSAPRFMRGAIGLGGRKIPVVDLGPRLGQAFCSTAARTSVLIVEVQREGLRMRMGLTADSVGERVVLGAREVVPAPSFGTTVYMDSFIAGMGRHKEGLVLLLDVDRILSASELLAAEEFAACAEVPTGFMVRPRALRPL
ncbi:purine-binding chemotaxis protein CheW [Stigmatella aurantiaca]|uniref:Purine-binding chemotaxis protein CheW n=1 Tax=Stigmatella aurantiaca TaxID=41 RepID=A0A1H7TYD0_STIAU|nr:MULTISPECIES: chemotaxis protein CheW [Stigmatella]SEL89741.1 purine-binding chemotaxis protein CheW [Stigmatella aurantiaca]